jgi:hypothetical protein
MNWFVCSEIVHNEKFSRMEAILYIGKCIKKDFFWETTNLNPHCRWIILVSLGGALQSLVVCWLKSKMAVAVEQSLK